MNTSESRGSSRLRTPFLNLTLKDDAWWVPTALLTPCRSVAGLQPALASRQGIRFFPSQS